MFESVVGRLQPILARLPGLIAGHVLHGRTQSGQDRRAASVEADAAAAARGAGFDIDVVTEADLEAPERSAATVELHDLERVTRDASLLPPGLEASPLGQREYSFRMPGLSRPIRIATDPACYEQHAESVELWSPGNPTFPEASTIPEMTGLPQATRLRDLLDEVACLGHR